jgi:hypothetical protein
MSLLPPPGGEPGSLGEVRAAQQRTHEPRDLARIGRAVRVDHGDDLPGRRLESTGQRVPLAPARLLHHPHVGPEPAGHRERVVHRVPIHHNHLVDAGRQPRENVRQIPCLIQCRNDHGYAWNSSHDVPRPHEGIHGRVRTAGAGESTPAPGIRLGSAAASGPATALPDFRPLPISREIGDRAVIEPRRKGPAERSTGPYRPVPNGQGPMSQDCTAGHVPAGSGTDW